MRHYESGVVWPSIGFVKRFPSVSVGDEFRALLEQDTFNYRFNDSPLMRERQIISSKQ